jgi:type IV fimbrial biogenesis protein FimT
MNTNRQHGFTLWELLMTLLVAGILLGIGVPNMMEFSRNASMTAAANDFVTATLTARTEAVKRQVPVTLCLSDNPTDVNPTCVAGKVSDSATRGFVVFVDENGNVDADGARILTDATDGNAAIDAGEVVLSQYAAPGASSNVRVSASCGYVTFAPTGFTRAVAAQPCNTPRLVLFCDDRGRRVAAGQLSSARVVRTPSAGRAQVLSEVAQVATLIALMNSALHGVPTTCPP